MTGAIEESQKLKNKRLVGTASDFYPNEMN
jgi:hypothetical protein